MYYERTIKKNRRRRIKEHRGKIPDCQTDKVPYRQDNIRQEKVNQEPRTSTTAYNLKMPQQTQFFANKQTIFKSRYINDNGRWTQDAVNDGLVDIKDYVSDIKNDEQGISFNGKEMRISDDFQPEKKIEDFQLNENKQDNTEYASWLDDRREDVKKVVDTGSYYANEGQKEAQRKVWRYGAQKFLREKMGCETSAWLLEHSLQDNPSDVKRGNDSRIAYLVNNSDVYLSALDNAISESKNGKIKGFLPRIIFGPDTEPDLYYSINKASIYVDGYKQDNGKWLIKATLSDTYDFTQIMTYMGDKMNEFSTKAGFGTIANDAAFVSQKLGAINPYEIKVEFYTTR